MSDNAMHDVVEAMYDPARFQLLLDAMDADDKIRAMIAVCEAKVRQGDDPWNFPHVLHGATLIVLKGIKDAYDSARHRTVEFNEYMQMNELMRTTASNKLDELKTEMKRIDTSHKQIEQELRGKNAALSRQVDALTTELELCKRMRDDDLAVTARDSRPAKCRARGPPVGRGCPDLSKPLDAVAMGYSLAQRRKEKTERFKAAQRNNQED